MKSDVAGDYGAAAGGGNIAEFLVSIERARSIGVPTRISSEGIAENALQSFNRHLDSPSSCPDLRPRPIHGRGTGTKETGQQHTVSALE